MAYEPTQWKAGDKLTANGLNKLEQGLANVVGGIYQIEINGSTLNITYNQAREILRSGQLIGFFSEFRDLDYGIEGCEFCQARSVVFYDGNYWIELQGEHYFEAIYMATSPDENFTIIVGN